MFVMKWYVLVTYGMAEGSLGTPFLSSGERVSAEAEKRTNAMVVQTATYGRSASHSRARVEVAILQRWSDVNLGGGLGGEQRRGDHVEMRAEEVIEAWRRVMPTQNGEDGVRIE
jgi:hypothetical protein